MDVILFVLLIFLLAWFFPDIFVNLLPKASIPQAVDAQPAVEKSEFAQLSSNAIKDRFTTIHQVQAALREAGLESSNLIVGVDFTQSNESQGRRTFNNLNLHTLFSKEKDFPIIYGSLNPYETAISILGRTLNDFDDDKIIDAFGFGDSSTGDKRVFPLSDAPCVGFTEVVRAYQHAAQRVQLSGPTSFVPLIERAIEIVKATKSYHILVIIADGAVTNVAANARAIARASEFPLSIVMVGVGDGPWDTMTNFDDNIPKRRFDNFQFVDLHRWLSESGGCEAAFAVAALQEIPDQYLFLRKNGLIG